MKCWWCLPARCRGVEFLPWVSLQLIFSGVQSFCTLARQPFLAASNKAASPLSKSWISVSPSFTKSKGVFPSLFFLVGSAPCCKEEPDGVCIFYSIFLKIVCLFLTSPSLIQGKMSILHVFWTTEAIPCSILQIPYVAMNWVSFLSTSQQKPQPSGSMVTVKWGKVLSTFYVSSDILSQTPAVFGNIFPLKNGLSIKNVNFDQISIT